MAAGPAPVTMARVLLQSSPEGAEILDDVGTSLGLAPQTLVVPVGSERQVTFRKPGFRLLERRFRAAADTTLAVRLDPEPSPPRRPRHEEPKNWAQPSGALDSAAGTIDPFRR
jgi:hypothetical protein